MAKGSKHDFKRPYCENHYLLKAEAAKKGAERHSLTEAEKRDPRNMENAQFRIDLDSKSDSSGQAQNEGEPPFLDPEYHLEASASKMGPNVASCCQK